MASDCILVKFDSRHDTIKRHDTNLQQEWRLSHHRSLSRQKITGVLSPRTSRNCASEYSKCYFANIQTESRENDHRRLQNDVYKSEYEKIYEMHGVKFLQNKHWDRTVAAVKIKLKISITWVC